MRETIHKEALHAISENARCTIAVAMGVGKTYIALKDMDRMFFSEAKFLVVAPKLSIIDSWKSEAKKFNMEHLLDHIEFITYLSFPKKAIMMGVTKLYLDEVHSLTYSHETILASYHGPILGLTGTKPTDPQSEKYIMVEKYCPVKYTYEVDSAVDDSILNDYEIKLHGLDLSTKKNHFVKTKNKSWVTSEKSNYEYWTNKIQNAMGKSLEMARIMRMRALMDFKTKEIYAKKLISEEQDQVIIFANTQKQADNLSAYSYHSKNKESENNLELFRKGDIKCLSTVLQLNEGVNVKAKRGIIMHAYSNERKTAQRIGRFLRLNPGLRSTIDILFYNDTVDQLWVSKALESFDNSKITHITP